MDDRGGEEQERRSTDGGESGMRRVGAKVAAAAKRLERSPRVVTAARRTRELLPGDSRFGDPLSTAGEEGPHRVGRRLSQLTQERPGALREAGLAAAQVWQALSEAQGRGRGETRLTIVFTDLASFSTWALEAGDTLVLNLLRDVGEAVEQPISERGGEVVKRLGDGLMAVFADPNAAIAAIFDARARVDQIDHDGYRPKLRAGVHVGRPRKLGGDYLGVDVNVTARLVDRAKAGEIVISDAALGVIETDGLTVRRRRFRAKGAPKDLTAYAVDTAG